MDKFKALFEQPAEMAADLPTPMKGSNGPRFAEKIDTPVTVHVAGSDEAPPPKPKAQRKATPIGPATPLPLDPEMVERFVAYMREREASRLRKEAGEPWPWSTDKILNEGRFCNVHREHDRITVGIRQTLIEPHRDELDLWFALVVARCCTNELGAITELGWPVPFDPMRHRAVFEAREARGEKVFRTDAFKPVMPPRELKGIHFPEYHAEYFLPPLWRDREQLRPRADDTLASFTDRLCEYPRLGGFYAAQVAADLKEVAPLFDAPDWKTFSRIGPGSGPGLNRICKRSPETSWSEAVWLATLLQLGDVITPQLEAAGIGRLSAQNVQHNLCELNKYEKAREGKPFRKYKPAKAPKPTRTKKAPTPAKPNVEVQDSRLMRQVRGLSDRLKAAAQRIKGSETRSHAAPAVEQQRTQPESPKFANDSDKAPNSTTSKTAANPSGNGAWRASGSKSEAERDTYAEDHVGEPFNDADLIRRGYQLTRVFDYTLADGSLLYQQNRYELKPGIPPLKQRPRKQFRPHRKVNGVDVFGAGNRRVLYNWPAIMRAGPGSFVFVPEGESKVEALIKAGWLATTVVSHKWTPECVAALTGQHMIILADHDEQGETLAGIAQHQLAPVAASSRIVPALHLWKHLPNGKTPKPGDDVVDWITREHGDPKTLLDICREIPAADFELGEEDAGALLDGIPPSPRGWLTAGQFCRSFLSGLVAPGDVGKTTLRLTQAIELATGHELLGMRIYGRRRVLFICFEDDRAELHRRMLAICKYHSINPAELKGWLFFRAISRAPKLAELDNKGHRHVGPLDGMLRRAIARTRCDLLILDPFIKLHALEESSNPDMDFVCELLIKIAQDYNIAVDSPAHTHKGAITAGDANARRGASAQRDAGRLDQTFTAMSEDEAKQFGIPIDERKGYMRLDKAKANIVRAIGARWFRLVSVPLGNTSTEYPDGDEVQAIERWKPPETWGDVSSEALNAILNEMEAEMPTGRRYSGKPQAVDRAAWKVVQKYCPSKTEAQCRQMIHEWIKAGVLFEAKYHDPVSRKEEWGLFIDRNKRPQY